MSKILPVPRLLPFVVDTFSPDSTCKHQFLTHAHKDHTDGIVKWGHHICCSADTASLVQLKFPALKDGDAYEFTLLEPFVEHTFEPPDMPGKEYRVHAIPVQHCAGAVAYLFRSSWFGTILHTGDGRLDARFAQQVQQLLGPRERLDLLYLDCTYGDKPQEFPSIPQAVRQVEQLVALWLTGSPATSSGSNDARVLLCCEGLGSEPVLKQISARFGGAKVFMPPSALCSGRAGSSPCSLQCCAIGFQTEELHHQRCQELQLLLPDSVTHDTGCGSSLQVHGGRLIQQHGREAAGQRLVVKVSTQWLVQRRTDCYRSLRDGQSMPAADKPQLQDGVYFVLYSMHSSRSELMELLKALKPRAALPFCGAADACLRPLLGSRVERDRVVGEMEAAVRAARQEAVLQAGSIQQMLQQQDRRQERPAWGWQSRDDDDQDEEEEDKAAADKENAGCAAAVAGQLRPALQPLGACTPHKQQQQKQQQQKQQEQQQQQRHLGLQQDENAQGMCCAGVNAWPWHLEPQHQHQQASAAQPGSYSGGSKRQALGCRSPENAALSGKRGCFGQAAAGSGSPQAHARVPLTPRSLQRQLSTLEYVPAAMRGLVSVCSVVRAQVRYS